ncbi:MAG TPA: condensation domain-containing protein [Pyrinomonadaceae bacterium]|nr:condensation domain-containing protein [Pyrinomonadaceae bacterium]
MSDLRQRITELSPQKRALLAMRLRKEHTRAAATQTIPRRAGSGTLPLSFNQEGLWFLDQLEPESPRFCLSGTLRIRGRLDADALRQSVNRIISRHESLRTTFVMVDEEPVQVVSPELSLDVPVIDLREEALDERESIASRLVAEEAMRPFDLGRGPLVRATLLRLADEEHLMMLTMHHIISDGQSLVIFMKELAAHYEAFSRTEEPRFEALPIQYADFAEWQREWLKGEVLDAQLDYWKKQLSGKLPTLELPTDRPRPPVQTYWSEDQLLSLPGSIVEPLNSLGKETGATSFMTLLSAFFALLHRYTGQDDIIVGSPIAGRRWSETEDVIGYFVNMLALRARFTPQLSFRQLLGQVREAVLGAYAHQDLPFGKLVAAIQPTRSLNRSPVFQVVFILIDSLKSIEAGGVTFEPLQIDRQTVKYDIIVFVEQSEEGLKALFMYNRDLFDYQTISRMLAHLQALVEGVVLTPDEPLLDISLAETPDERESAHSLDSTDRDEHASFLF